MFTLILLCWEVVGAQLRLNELCYMPGWYVVGIFCTAKIGVVQQQTSEKDTFFLSRAFTTMGPTTYFVMWDNSCVFTSFSQKCAFL